MMDIVIRRQQEQSLWVLSSIVVDTQTSKRGKTVYNLIRIWGNLNIRFVDRINVNTVVVIVQYHLQNATSEGTGKSARNSLISYRTECESTIVSIK